MDTRSAASTPTFPRRDFWAAVDRGLAESAERLERGQAVSRRARQFMERLPFSRDDSDPEPRSVLDVCVTLRLERDFLEPWLRSRTVGRPDLLPAAVFWAWCPHCPESEGPHLRRLTSPAGRRQLPARPGSIAGDFEYTCHQHSSLAGQRRWRAQGLSSASWGEELHRRSVVAEIQKETFSPDARKEYEALTPKARRRKTKEGREARARQRALCNKALPDAIARVRANELIANARRGNKDAQAELTRLWRQAAERRKSQRGERKHDNQVAPRIRRRQETVRAHRYAEIGKKNFVGRILLRAGITKPKRRTQPEATLGEFLLSLCRGCRLIGPELDSTARATHRSRDKLETDARHLVCLQLRGQGDLRRPAGRATNPRLLGQAFACLLAHHYKPEAYGLRSLAKTIGVKHQTLEERLRHVIAHLPATTTFIFGPLHGQYVDKILGLPRLLDEKSIDRVPLAEHLLDHGMGLETVLRLAGREQDVRPIIARRQVADAEVWLSTGLDLYRENLEARGVGDPRFRRVIDRVERELGKERVVIDLTRARLGHHMQALKAQGMGRNGAKQYLNVVKRACRFSGVSIVLEIPVTAIVKAVYGSLPRRPPRPSRCWNCGYRPDAAAAGMKGSKPKAPKKCVKCGATLRDKFGRLVGRQNAGVDVSTALAPLAAEFTC